MTDDGAVLAVISGVVESGLGDGKVFLASEYYMNSVETAMGFSPHPGTLNVNVGRSVELPEGRCVVIPGKDGYGSVKAWAALVGTDSSFSIVYRAAVLRPEMTAHGPEILELVSPDDLRTKLGVKDGDIVFVRLV